MTAWAYLWTNEFHAEKRIKRIEIPDISPMQQAADKAGKDAVNNPKTFEDAHAKYLRQHRHGLPVDKKSDTMGKDK